jgi:predicted transcriptional regulator
VRKPPALAVGIVTQSQLAKRIKSTQARVAKVEAGSPDVSLDLMFRSLFVAGGNLDDVTAGRQIKQPSKVKNEKTLFKAEK